MIFWQNNPIASVSTLKLHSGGPLILVRIGCLESLVHYKRILIRNHKEKVNTQALVKECQALLSQLEEIDPMRSRRYEEIGSFADRYKAIN